MNHKNRYKKMRNLTKIAKLTKNKLNPKVLIKRVRVHQMIKKKSSNTRSTSNFLLNKY